MTKLVFFSAQNCHLETYFRKVADKEIWALGRAPEMSERAKENTKRDGAENDDDEAIAQ